MDGGYHFVTFWVPSNFLILHPERREVPKTDTELKQGSGAFHFLQKGFSFSKIVLAL